MIKKLIQKEIKRQYSVINLIPSENYVSADVLAALGSPLTNKYAEGYSKMRYYFGNSIVDEIETQVVELAAQAFDINLNGWSINVQAYAGSIANIAVYSAMLELGDSVLAMALEHGGHLTHGHSVNWTSKLYKFHHYGVDANGFIDYKQVSRLALEHKPKLIICGGSAYPRFVDYAKFKEIAQTVNAILMADISHEAGLVAGKVAPSPFQFADIVTTTTQ